MAKRKHIAGFKKLLKARALRVQANLNKGSRVILAQDSPNGRDKRADSLTRLGETAARANVSGMQHLRNGYVVRAQAKPVPNNGPGFNPSIPNNRAGIPSFEFETKRNRQNARQDTAHKARGEDVANPNHVHAPPPKTWQKRA